ncbi:DUF4366 domain-containing protein [Thomasclavelia ramosa]|uniref:DUF4366 domain-containing protein n=1 Tax=Thomasclavelia ramosa TaxID=1547 RepID=UPI003DA64851
MTIKKRWLMTCLALALCTMFAMPVTAYASGGEVPTETATEEKKEESQEETSGPALTPDGNLTLVDDVGASSSKGKQFVTLVSKNGNYFYLIIDRDDKGNSTVHFLNQVDEADLMALMDEKDAEKLKTELAQKEEAKVQKETPPVKDEQKVEEKEDKTFNILPFVILIVVIAGGGVFAFIKFKNKKRAEETKPDPDVNYNEDELDEEEEYDFFDDEDEEIVDEEEEEEK